MALISNMQPAHSWFEPLGGIEQLEDAPPDPLTCAGISWVSSFLWSEVGYSVFFVVLDRHIHPATQHSQQGKHLIDGFFIICLIQQSVELAG